MSKILLIASLCFLVSCSESNFVLSPESRLPKWFDIPEGEEQSDYTATLDYYINRNGHKAVLKIKKKHGFFWVKRISIKLKSLGPTSFNGRDSEGLLIHPSYEVLSAEGITDVVEHKYRNNIFYMNDDPDVWEKLGIER